MTQSDNLPATWLMAKHPPRLISPEPAQPTAASSAALQAAYHDLAAAEPEVSSTAPWLHHYWQHHASRLAFDLDAVRALAPPGTTIIEAGSLPLLLTLALSRSGYRVEGTDLAPERMAASLDRHRLQVHRLNLETEPLPFPSRHATLVVFNELFEHLRLDPIHTLEEVRRVLAPNGRLLLSTPNLRSLPGLKNLLLHNRGWACCADPYSEYMKLRQLGHMGHVREYTSREVVEFLEAVGFRVEQVVFRGWCGGRWSRLVERAVPSLRPYLSVVASPGHS